jgi:hypothetical protein
METIASGEDFAKVADTYRKQNPNKWVCFERVVNGKLVQVKLWNTWPQQLLINGMNHAPSNCDMLVRQFKSYISATIQRVCFDHMR